MTKGIGFLPFPRRQVRPEEDIGLAGVRHFATSGAAFGTIPYQKEEIVVMKIYPALLCFALFGFGACKPTDVKPQTTTMETTEVEQSLASFKKNPSEAHLKEVENALAKLDSEIKELEVHAAKAGGAAKSEVTVKLEDLRAKYAAYQTDFTTAKVSASVNKAGQATGEAVEKAGDAIQEAADSVGDTFKSNQTNQ